jgi:septal ring-binding cell division protein DamX
MLPVPHVIGIVVLLVAITTVSSWQYFSDNSLTEEATISQQSQELAIIIDGADPAPLQHLTQQQTTAIVGLTVLEEDIVKQQLKSPMPIEDDLVLQQAKADALKAEIKDLSAKIKSQERQLSAAIEKSQIGQVDLKISQLSDTIKPIIDQDAALVLGASRVAAAVTSEAVAMPLVQKPIAETIRSQNAVDDEVLNTQQFVNAQPLTAQNLLPQEAAIADILNPSISDLYLEPKIISAEPLNAQSTVLSGLGTEQQLAILSAELKSNIDPKLLRGISELNKSAKKTASTQTILVSEVHDLALENIPIKSESTTVIVESSIAVKPKFWPNQQDNESWSNANIIQKWPSSGFTIQLIASQSSDSIKQFIASMPNAEKMYAYPTRLKNKLWNVVIYGQYPSRSVANAAIAKLPIKLQQLKPWVKSISSVKSSIE